jgi:hypothetical protein
MGWTCSMHEELENIRSENLKGRDHWRDMGINGR